MDHLLSIKSFVTVVRFTSFRKAASHLKMSPAALTRAIKNLETHTRTRLLQRTTRHVRLADSARDYYATCCELLDRLIESEQRLADDQNRAAGEIRIVAHPLAVESGLPQLLDRVRANSTGIRMVMHTESRPLRLELGDYDVAVYPGRLISDLDAICRTLVSSPWILVASSAYWERVAEPPTERDFSRQILVVCEGMTNATSALRLRREGLLFNPTEPASRLVVTESAAIRLALDGHGLALVPQMIVQRYVAAGKLQIVLPGYNIELEPAELDLAYMRRPLLPRRTRDFVDACLRYYRGLPIGGMSIARRRDQTENRGPANPPL
jgi:DNA-binding transcriptional LysR family regulator